MAHTIWQPITIANQTITDQCSCYPLTNTADIMRKQKHRLTEKNRHKKIIDLITELSEMIGLNGKQKQNCVLSCAARYALFLSHIIEIYNNQKSLSYESFVNLHEIHRKACEEVASLQNSNSSLPLKKKLLAKSIPRKRFNCDVRFSDVSDTISQYLSTAEAVITPQSLPPPQSYDQQIVMSSPKTPDHCLPLKKRARMLMYSDLI